MVQPLIDFPCATFAFAPEHRDLSSFGSLLLSYSYALVSFCWISSVIASRWKIQEVVCSLSKHVLAADYCCSFMDNLEKSGGKGKKARKTSQSFPVVLLIQFRVLVR
jgi:hypothetical protein